MLSCPCMFLGGLSQKDLFGEKGRDTRVLHSHFFFFVLGLEDICHACQKPLDLHRFSLSVLLGFHDILLKSFYPRTDTWQNSINNQSTFNKQRFQGLMWHTVSPSHQMAYATQASLTSLLLYLKIVWLFICSCSLYNGILCINI